MFLNDRQYTFTIPMDLHEYPKYIVRFFFVPYLTPTIMARLKLLLYDEISFYRLTSFYYRDH